MTGEAYYYLPGGKARCHAHAEAHAGVSGFGASLLESFTLCGEDPHFPGAPSGSWCIVTDGTAPPAGFRPVTPEASAAAEACRAMADALSDQGRLLGQLVAGLADLDVSAFQ